MKKELTNSSLFKLYVKLMSIHNNVYVFLSGIFISLSTNLLTSLCFEPKDEKGYWCIYLTIVFSAISGAVFIIVATELTPLQERIKETLAVFKNDDIKTGDPMQIKRKKVLLIELTENRVKYWTVIYTILFLSTLFSIAFTILKFVLF